MAERSSPANIQCPGDGVHKPAILESDFDNISKMSGEIRAGQESEFVDSKRGDIACEWCIRVSR
jgi:hypothetical protein